MPEAHRNKRFICPCSLCRNNPAYKQTFRTRKRHMERDVRCMPSGIYAHRPRAVPGVKKTEPEEGDGSGGVVRVRMSPARAESGEENMRDRTAGDEGEMDDMEQVYEDGTPCMLSCFQLLRLDVTALKQ